MYCELRVAEIYFSHVETLLNDARALNDVKRWKMIREELFGKERERERKSKRITTLACVLFVFYRIYICIYIQ